jgi:DNA-binding NtrC family response regulator
VVNVRFIAATNRDPEEATKAGVLRQDLYYRLRVVPIRVPGLRERPEDIPVLARHFLAHYWNRHRNGSPVPRLTEAAIRALQSRPWQGNVRELQNVIEHAVVLLEPGGDVQPEDIPLIGDAGDLAETTPFLGDAFDERYHNARERLIGEFERRYLTGLVARAGGNMSKAARLAGVDRTTLYRLMEKHNLQREGGSVEPADEIPERYPAADPLS